MEKKLRSSKSPEDNLFYYHPSEDRIVLSHALFWVMTQSLKGKIAKRKTSSCSVNMRRKCSTHILTEDAYFPELLRYCNIMFEFLPIIQHHIYDFSSDKAARKLATIAIVAAGYGGDMPEDLANELLDDMDFHYNKVKCRKIEQLLPRLNQYGATEEML